LVDLVEYMMMHGLTNPKHMGLSVARVLKVARDENCSWI